MPHLCCRFTRLSSSHVQRQLSSCWLQRDPMSRRLTCMVLSERVRVPGTRLVEPISFMKASQPYGKSGQRVQLTAQHGGAASSNTHT